MVSTVDPEARHGHKTAARGFDGYKGHTAVDPDSEIITATTVSPGNTADGAVAEDLIADLLGAGSGHGDTGAAPGSAGDGERTTTGGPAIDEESGGDGGASSAEQSVGGDEEPATVYGDNAYGTGEFQDLLGEAGINSRCKTPQPTAAGGLFTKDRFDVDLETDTVTCPAGRTATVRRGADGAGIASFGDTCPACPLRAQCTQAADGRTIRVGVHEQALSRARTRQAAAAWQVDYRTTRPKVERKLAHLMRRKHGGRRARVRGQAKIDADFRLLAAATNLARLATLGVRFNGARWTPATT